LLNDLLNPLIPDSDAIWPLPGVPEVISLEKARHQRISIF
jgi:hypothetical protein